MLRKEQIPLQVNVAPQSLFFFVIERSTAMSPYEDRGHHRLSVCVQNVLKFRAIIVRGACRHSRRELA
ncbi:MAG: hypothetical protein ACI8Z1_002390 [Candidatus Azotimanducaceae bacterium]|jgi:hypothetical protein